jgi:glycerophosphoryl diester phosphodiesterase
LPGMGSVMQVTLVRGSNSAPQSPVVQPHATMGDMATLTRPAWLTSTPIAHRGLHDLGAGRPENSLAAFDAAAEASYPCELDVQLTDSGELIVLHDFDLSRATGRTGRTATLTAEDLPDTRLFGTDQRVPTLAQVLDCVRGRIPLQVEIKRAPGNDPKALATAVIAALRKSDEEHAISSFDPFVVYQLRAAKSPYAVGQISGLLESEPLPRRLLGRYMAGNFVTRPDFISYELAGLPSRVVQVARRSGVPVITWGVKSREDEARARKHADNIIFDGYLP